jgi:PEP-CTERM motif
MRKSLWIIVAVLFVAIAAPNAHADSSTDGTINFTVSSGGPTPTGSFVFDDTTDTLTSYTVTWDGVLFNLQPLLSSFTLVDLEASGTWCGVASGATPPDGCFGPGEMTLSTLSFLVANTGTGVYTINSAVASGSYVVTATTVAPTPEPGSVALMLLGVGVVFVMWKRIGRGLPQAS